MTDPEDASGPAKGLSAIAAPVAAQVSEAPDALTVKAEAALKLEMDVRPTTVSQEPPNMDELQRRSFQQDISERKRYANMIFYLIVAWLVAVLILLFLHGAGRLDCFRHHDTGAYEFKLTDQVVLALIGGTTVTVLGLFVIVANYLFSKK